MKPKVRRKRKIINSLGAATFQRKMEELESAKEIRKEWLLNSEESQERKSS